MKSDNDNGNDYYNVLLIGDKGSGRRTFLSQLIDEPNDSDHVDTIGITYKYKTISLSNKEIKIRFMIIALPNSPEKKILLEYCKNSDLLMFIYDSTSPSSFKVITECLNIIHNEKDNDDLAKILIETKCDLEKERMVDTTEGLNAAL